MITGKETGTLVVFIFSIIFVIYAVRIPIPRKLQCFGIRRFPINLTTAPVIAIAILWAAQCIDPNVIWDGIVGTNGVKPYNILILFFSQAYMAITLDGTGILQAAAYWVSNKGGANVWRLYFYFYTMLTLLSVLFGNNPVILSGTAFMVYYTLVVELEPLPWLIAGFAAANTASMVLFVGNATNVVICEEFGVNNIAFTAYTILPFIACNIVCFIALAFQYRSPKNLPRRISPIQLDARSVLLDPVSACVGSIMFGFCLVVIIVVSFFGVDAWKISLPFAVVKVILDLAWDRYSYNNNRAMIFREQTSTVEKSNPPIEIDVIWTKAGSRGQGTPLSRNSTVQNGPLVDLENIEMILNNPSTQSAYTSKPLYNRLKTSFPTFFTALPRLPFALVPFAFSQFILIEGLAHQGWIDVFAGWLVRASHRQMHPTIWIVGVIGVLLCNISGTNIGATILLTKVVRAADMPDHTLRAAAIALAVASNIGAVSFTFSASLAGLLWRSILNQKGIKITQIEFAKWNVLPLTAMTVVGLGVVSAEMAILYKGTLTQEEGYLSVYHRHEQIVLHYWR